jgi:Mycothiol maleylpyruvate isomerase N-terminal domain
MRVTTPLRSEVLHLNQILPVAQYRRLLPCRETGPRYPDRGRRIAAIAGAVVGRGGSVVADPRDLHRRAGGRAADVIARVRPDQLGNATSCTEWDVRALISHVVGGNLRFAAMVVGENGPGSDEGVLGGEPLAGFLDSFDGLCAAFNREGFLEELFSTPLGEGPGGLLVALCTAGKRGSGQNG